MSAERLHILIPSPPPDLGHKDRLFWWLYADILWRDAELQRLPFAAEFACTWLRLLRAPGLAFRPVILEGIRGSPGLAAVTFGAEGVPRRAGAAVRLSPWGPAERRSRSPVRCEPPGPLAGRDRRGAAAPSAWQRRLPELPASSRLPASCT
ncbi:unnamed protein product [Coccothraustes coccothraustes]